MPTVLVSEEPGEVPFDSIPQDAPSLGLDFCPLPQWVGVIPIHINLAIHIEFDIIGVANFLISALVPGSQTGCKGKARICKLHSACRLVECSLCLLCLIARTCWWWCTRSPGTCPCACRCLWLRTQCVDWAQGQSSQDVHTVLARPGLLETHTERQASAGRTHVPWLFWKHPISICFDYPPYCSSSHTLDIDPFLSHWLLSHALFLHVEI